MTRRRLITAWLLLLYCAASVPYALRVGIDNRIELWLNPGSQASQDYAAFRDQFGSDEFVVAAYMGKPIFDEHLLEVQLGVLETLEAIPSVSHVLSVPGVYRDQFGAEDRDAFEREIRTQPAYQHLVFRSDPDVAGYVIETSPGELPAGRRNLLAEIQSALAPLREEGYEVHLAGPPRLNVALDEASRREAARTFPWAFVASIAVLLLLFRDIRATAANSAAAGLAILMTLGLMGMHHSSLNMVTSALPTLLWVLSLAGSIHITRRYQEHRASAADFNEAMAHALTETTRPCIIASVTTALGFLALMTADMAPVRELGIYAASGLLCSLLVNLFVLPLFLRWLRTPGLPARNADKAGWAHRWSHRSLRWRSLSVTLTAGVFVAGVWSIGHIRLESDPLSFLPESDPVVRDYDFIGKHFSGYYTLEVVVNAPEGWLNDAFLPLLDGLSNELSGVDGVARVLSPVDLLKLANTWEGNAYALPGDAAAATVLVESLDDAVQAQLYRLVSNDGKQVRLSLFVNVMNSTPFLRLQEEVNRKLAVLPAEMRAHATGIVSQLVDAQRSLVRTQVKSLALSFVLVFTCIWIGLRSFHVMLISILPNLFPLVVGGMTMHWLDIPLDAATVMGASVAMGIAVDDTVHLLATWRATRMTSVSRRIHTAVVLERLAPAMVITTVVACIGFFALMRSAFLPIACFGLLSGVAMLAALWADFFLLPAMLAWRDKP